MRVTRDANGGLIAESLGRRVLLPWQLVASILAEPRAVSWDVDGEITAGEVVPRGIQVEIPEIGEGITFLEHEDPDVLEAALIELAIEHGGHLRRGNDPVPELAPGEVLLWAWPEYRVPEKAQAAHTLAIAAQAARGVRVVVATFSGAFIGEWGVKACNVEVKLSTEPSAQERAALLEAAAEPIEMGTPLEDVEW